MRRLPNPQTLSDAVHEVIDSNTADGYPPTRFIGATQGGFAPNLLAVCSKLINDRETLQWLEKPLQGRPLNSFQKTPSTEPGSFSA